MEGINSLFEKYQSLLIDFANNRYGRRQLAIGKEYDKYRIIKLTPNSFHVRLIGNRFQGEFRSYPLYGNILGMALTDFDIVKNSHYASFINKDELKGLFHYLNPVFLKEYPYILHVSGDAIYSSAGDGDVSATSASSWATARGAATGTVTGTATTFHAVYTGDNVNDYVIKRGFEPFDTSGIGARAIVNSATLSLWPTVVVDNASGSIVLILTTQASATSLAAGDYANLTLDTPTEGATRKTLAGLTTGQYNDISLNTTGLTWINVTGTTFLGTRERRDVDNVAPTSATVNRALCSASEEAGTTQDPKLVVNYSVPGGGFLFFM